jgi:XTP/dITP diphosphohydrolase
MPGSNELWFATSNGHKFEEARFALRGFGVALKRLPAKGAELQSDDVVEIARNSAMETFERARRPLFVEDTGLFVPALNGFPGPYASYVNRTIGPECLITLMRGVRKREAEFVSAVAYCSRRSEVRIFSGRLRGRISEAAEGTNGFGFDPVFIPFGSELTLAEMSLEEKSETSHRSLALRALGRWLESRRSR